ncbi:unnamed protein product, partial [Prorocentrum cordatum]
MPPDNASDARWIAERADDLEGSSPSASRAAPSLADRLPQAAAALVEAHERVGAVRRPPAAASVSRDWSRSVPALSRSASAESRARPRVVVATTDMGGEAPSRASGARIVRAVTVRRSTSVEGRASALRAAAYAPRPACQAVAPPLPAGLSGAPLAGRLCRAASAPSLGRRLAAARAAAPAPGGAAE